MTTRDFSTLEAEFPFAGKLRSRDREQMLVQIMASVWETTLELPLLARDSGPAEDLNPCREPVVSGSIRIMGVWQGSLTLTAPRTFAAKCTAIMLKRPAEGVSEPEIRDAWGELVNMVGGHLKALVPAPSHLGLPVVIDLADYPGDASGPPGTQRVDRVTFACLGQRLRLTVEHPQV
jgi:chemotaxis protein CheX